MKTFRFDELYIQFNKHQESVDPKRQDELFGSHIAYLWNEYEDAQIFAASIPEKRKKPNGKNI